MLVLEAKSMSFQYSGEKCTRFFKKKFTIILFQLLNMMLRLKLLKYLFHLFDFFIIIVGINDLWNQKKAILHFSLL